MAKNKRRHNQKARSGPKPSASTVPSETVALDFNYDERKFDESNALVLPAKTTPDTEEVPAGPVRKKLSKKEKKKLQNVVDRRKKKANRSNVLEELQKYQIGDTEYKAMASASLIQTKGLKRHFQIVENHAKHGTSDASPSEMYKTGKKFKSSSKSVEEPEEIDLNCVSYQEDNETSESEAEEFVDATDELRTPMEVLSEVDKIDVPKKEQPVPPESVAKDIPVAISSEPTCFMKLDRKPEMELARRKLPVVAEEQAVMEAIRYNRVVIICGETGSGKTTQVPQFLFEAGYAREKIIGVTEPRRVAAMSMARRVGEEMNLPEAVSYHIRYENNVTKKTKIKFMTDGVLLREVQNDFLLTKYSAIIIDEAHERSVFSDILVGLLSRVVPLREKKGDPLKLIIMSATLRIDDFASNVRLFKTPPPIIKVESRQFPVSVHFAKFTPDDYLQAAYSKVCKIHRNQPDGGILVFVTGKHEVHILCRKLRRAFPFSKTGNLKSKKPAADEKVKDVPEESGKRAKPKVVNDILPKISLDDYKDTAAFIEEADDDDDEDSDNEFALSDEEDDDRSPKQPLFCLPLYSNLSKEKQNAVWKNAPPGCRLCVIATNVAETSLTIPNVKYVIDTGKVKSKLYDKTTGVSAFQIEWCSKASADQRAGRAGRTSAGHCYRLFSSAVFNDSFLKFSEPELVRKPIEDLMLQIKSLNIDNVINFPFPSPPSREALKAAEEMLILMGALERPIHGRHVKLTSLGRAMSHFPISPRYSKMLAYSYKELLPYVIAVISGLTVQELFLNCSLPVNEDGSVGKFKKQGNSWANLRKKWSGVGNEKLLGDANIILKAIGSSEFVGCSPVFCERNGLRHKAMVEVHKLRKQLTSEVNNVFGRKNFAIELTLDPPTDTHAKHLRQLMVAGFCDHVARRYQEGEATENKMLKNAYQSIQVDGPVYIHADSLLKDEKPEFVVYQEIHETSRMYMRNVVAIEAAWLPIYAASLCNLSKPLEDPAPFYDSETDSVRCFRSATFGPHHWPLPQTEHAFPDDIDKYKWFGRFLLEGKVVPFLEQFSKMLLTHPSTLNKSWAKLQPRTTSLTSALATAKIDSLESLNARWGTEPNYLLQQYKEWLPDNLHSIVEVKWITKTK